MHYLKDCSCLELTSLGTVSECMLSQVVAAAMMVTTTNVGHLCLDSRRNLLECADTLDSIVCIHLPHPYASMYLPYIGHT